ncbi:MAG: 1-pyrroline-5-carboxylate dehydrogenase [Betaproteobacteria bacterium]|nr:MAG: 1-pyrroline-5-carboxylate dehydrogenase [Betaproteobacteria bacterium]TMH92055.1 MAG: 1-pyrroline-5-carboxylate dehydrogenase [Betaproteobacteria bacterium]
MSAFSNAIYVRVSKNRFRLKNIGTGAEADVTPTPGFTTTRLLVGQFRGAQTALKEAMGKVIGKGLFTASPGVVIQPLEMTDGGLSEIEERAFRELAVGAGAGKVVVWIGHELSDSEVKGKLDGK